MSDKPWMWSVFSKDEIDELLSNSSRIVWDQENGLVVHLSLSNNQCMEFVHHYTMTREIDVADAMESTEFIEGFLYDLVAHIHEHLEQESPNWQERYYSVDEPTDSESDDDEE